MEQPICLALTPNHKIEPVPHPTFVSGEAYVCPRCGREFSGRDITVQSLDYCVFDPNNREES